MTGIDKATGRVVALVVLLIVAAVALRGYLPGAERPPPRATERQRGKPAGRCRAGHRVAGDHRARAHRAAAGSADGAADRRWPGRIVWRYGMRPTWRFLLIGLGVILAWLLIVLLLARLGVAAGYRSARDRNGIEHHAAQRRARPTTACATGGRREHVRVPRGGHGDPAPAGRRGNRCPLSQTATSREVLPRRARSFRAASHPASGPESLARAAELGLVEIGDLSREPREAIIACYAAMESALANAPGAVPQDSDTPSEVLARAVEHHALHADNATQLVDLFTEARFSPHVMNEGHREVAVRMLRLVLAELRSVA